MPNRKTRRIVIALLALVIIAVALYFFAPRPPVPAWASVEDGIAIQHDVTYCTAGGVELKMDLYQPPPLEARPAPVLLYVHGGGWQSGDKSWVNRIVLPRNLVARGYLVAAIDYRLAPQYKWPAQIEDAKCAVRYLRANAATYHLDPEKIGVWGESAGGQLVALLGLTNAADGFEGDGGYVDQSSAVQAVVDMCGPTDFAAVEMNAGNTLLAQLLLGFQPDLDFLKRVSPVTYVAADAPPFLILHGDKDSLVTPNDSRELYAGLTQAGATATLVMVQNSEHVFASAGGPISPTLTEINWQVADFFDRTLQPGVTSVRTFQETHRSVRGVFLDFWNSNGGLPFPGYPLSEALREDGTTVQYFERAVLQLDAAGKVALAPLGMLLYREKYPAGAPAQAPNNTGGSLAFVRRGTRLGGKFLDFWREHDGAGLLSDPISDEFNETQPDGSAVKVQYFERAVLEYHPENTAPNDVIAHALGRQSYQMRYYGEE